MARNVITTVELTDDLDGGRADRTVTFAWDGTTYEIDLSKKNATALEKLLKPYIDEGRRVRGTRAGRGRSRPASASRRDVAEVRTWAAQNGYDVSARGRIPAAVLEAYDSTH